MEVLSLLAPLERPVANIKLLAQLAYIILASIRLVVKYKLRQTFKLKQATLFEC